MAKELSKEAKKLVEKYGLIADPKDPDSDIFGSHQFTIITRKGIDKLIAKAKVEIPSIDILFIDPFEVVMKGVYTDGTRTVTTTASASTDRTVEYVVEREEDVIAKDKDGNPLGGPVILKKKKSYVEQVVIKKGNVKQNPPYLSEMCEKRLNSRGVLKLTGFYDLGIYGEDEADDFGKFAKESAGKANRKPMASVSKNKV